MSRTRASRISRPPTRARTIARAASAIVSADVTFLPPFATVTVDQVRGCSGSLEGQRARKGVLITTSDFSKEARDYLTRIEKRIVLINGPELADLMIEHGIRVTDVATYTLKRGDRDNGDRGPVARSS